jgi:hypothetical protein
VDRASTCQNTLQRITPDGARGLVFPITVVGIPGQIIRADDGTMWLLEAKMPNLGDSQNAILRATFTQAW